MRINEFKNEIFEIKKWEEKIKRKEVEMDQINVLENMV